MNLSLLWFSSHVISTDTKGNEELHILSCHCRSQTIHYCLIKAAGDNAIIFIIPSKESIADFIFMKQVRPKLMLLLMDNGQLRESRFSYFNN